jgi:hypothetical protein
MTVPTVVMMPKKKNTTASNGFPEHCIDELLELIPGAESTSQSRSELVIALQLAQMFHEGGREEQEREQPSSKQIEQLEESIEKTCVLLRRIRGYDDFANIGFVMQQIGRGVVAVGLAQGLPRNPSISDEELVFPSGIDGKVATMNIEPLLRATLLRVRRRRRRGRGGPKSLGKEAVVFYAEGYFRRHSVVKPSTAPKNPFHGFAERFYEVVTETEPDSLVRQMRRVFATRCSGR